MSKKILLFMLICNYLPLLHVAVAAFIIFKIYSLTNLSLLFGILYFYLAPPIIARIILFFFPIKNSKIEINSLEYCTWWLVFNLQVIFSRFPFTEEILRTIPTFYSNWLRLWGGKIGKLTYWSPSTVITDRSFLNVGDHVVIGAGARLISHLIIKDKNNKNWLLLKNVEIGDHVVVGGYSVLGPGVSIDQNVATRAFFLARPFTNITQSTTSEDIE